MLQCFTVFQLLQSSLLPLPLPLPPLALLLLLPLPLNLTLSLSLKLELSLKRKRKSFCSMKRILNTTSFRIPGQFYNCCGPLPHLRAIV